MANDTHADAREELQVRASWFSLLGPFHTPGSTSFLEEERTHGKSWSLSAESASQLRPWSHERVPQLHVCQWTLSWFHKWGNRSDRNACRGKTWMAALEWGRTSQLEVVLSTLRGWCIQDRSYLCQSDPGRRGRTLGCRGKSSTSPLPRWGHLLFFSQGLTLSTSPTLVSLSSSRRMPAHLHLRQSKWAQDLSWSPIALGSGIFTEFSVLRFPFKLWNWVSVSLFHEMCHQKKRVEEKEINSRWTQSQSLSFFSKHLNTGDYLFLSKFSFRFNLNIYPVYDTKSIFTNADLN